MSFNEDNMDHTHEPSYKDLKKELTDFLGPNATKCDDCQKLRVEIYHWDTLEGCHEVCRKCAIKRGIKVNYFPNDDDV